MTGATGEIGSIDMKAEACGSHVKKQWGCINGSPPPPARRPFGRRRAKRGAASGQNTSK
jgi:hypothetical protein